MFVKTNSKKEPPAETLHVFDQLELENTDVPDIPKDIIFPDELNRYLRDKIRHLSHENGMLRKNLSENESILKQSQSQVSTLSSQLEKYTSATNGFLSASEVASVKIVDLSKKLREKSSEMETLKTKCSKLEQKIVEMQKDEKKNDVDVVPVKEKPHDGMEEELKKAQDKLASTSSKLFEALNSNTQLKNDLKLANKLMQQEIGEPLEKFQNNNSPGWRGRAQLICDLQQKNAELKEKLKSMNEKLEKRDCEISKNKHDKRVETLTKEIYHLECELKDTKKKLDAFKARSRVLEMECTVVKTKLMTLNDNSERDQQLINTLTAQLSNTQNSHNDALKQKQSTVQKLEKENKSLNLELAREKLRSENLEKEVKACRQEIENLTSSIRQRPSSFNSVHSSSDRSFEVERNRLLELIAVSNERLERERELHAQTQAQQRLEKQKAAKFESKLARMKLEQSIDKCSVYSNSSTCSSKPSKEHESLMEDRLELAEEQIKALQTRLDIERNERQMDFTEFSKILQNYNFSQK